MPKSTLSLYLHIIAVAVIVFALGHWLMSSGAQHSTAEGSYVVSDSSASPQRALAQNDRTESVYDRVMRTQTIRCGYVVYYPLFKVDPNTKQPSGIFYDVMEKLSERLRLKIDWTVETGWGSTIQELQAGKYDINCGGAWINSDHARHIGFSEPLFYMPVYPIVRHDDRRFDADISLINDPSVRINTLDGDIPVAIHAEKFPKSQLITLQNLTDFSQLLMDIKANKADVTFLDADYGTRFAQSNPNSVKVIKTNPPIRLYPTALMLSADDTKLNSMLNTAIKEMTISGEIERILEKYQASSDSYILPANPYRHSTGN